MSLLAPCLLIMKKAGDVSLLLTKVIVWFI